MSFITREISRRTEETWEFKDFKATPETPKEETDAVVKSWYYHWFGVAYDWKKKCLEEGLVNTAKDIQEEIDFQKKFRI